MTRGQMAAFLNRALNLKSAPSAKFADTGGHLFKADIDRLYAAGITSGCAPNKFCPDRLVHAKEKWLHFSCGVSSSRPGGYSLHRYQQQRFCCRYRGVSGVIRDHARVYTHFFLPETVRNPGPNGRVLEKGHGRLNSAGVI